MADNKNSVVNVFGYVSKIVQRIFSAEKRVESTDISTDIDFIIKDISGKIGDLSLSPQNAVTLNKKLDDLKNAKNDPEKKSALEGIKDLMAKSGSAIVSKGISATIDAILQKFH